MNRTVDDVDDFLAHYGRKGMKWGVRNEPSSSGSGRSSKGSSSNSGRTPSQRDVKSQTPEDAQAKKELRKARAKKVAIGVGILVAVAGTAYVANQMNQNGNRRVKDLPKPSPKVKKKTEDAQMEPTTLIYATRNKKQGFSFRQKGSLPDPLNEYSKAFDGTENQFEMFSRYGKDNEKVAARFLDPEGRTDSAGRVIPHEVIIPKSMASGINNLDDVRSKIWPSLKDEYARGYDTPDLVDKLRNGEKL